MATAVIVPTEAYATLADVQELLPGRKYTADSKPTAQQIESFLKRNAKILDARLRSLGFDVPLTGSDDIEVMKQMNALAGAIFAERGTIAGVQGDSPILDRLIDELDKLLEDLSNGRFTFATAGDSPTSDGDGPDELDTAGDRADPVFQNSTDRRENQF